MQHGPRETGGVAGVAAFLLAATLAGAPANAQQVTGLLGSPGATTTIDGKQLPPPSPKFGGVIKETLTGSKTWWRRKLCRPKVRRMCCSS